MRRTPFLALATSVVLAVVASAMVTWSPSRAALPAADSALVADAPENAVCADSAVAGRPESTETQVKPGCCSSNCVTDRDCNRICGKGVCVCIVESSCCSRCTY